MFGWPRGSRELEGSHAWGREDRLWQCLVTVGARPQAFGGPIGSMALPCGRSQPWGWRVDGRFGAQRGRRMVRTPRAPGAMKRARPGGRMNEHRLRVPNMPERAATSLRTASRTVAKDELSTGALGSLPAPGVGGGAPGRREPAEGRGRPRGSMAGVGMNSAAAPGNRISPARARRALSRDRCVDLSAPGEAACPAAGGRSPGW